ELSKEELHRLANGIVLRLLKLGAYEGVIEEVIGRKFILKNEVIKNATTFTDIINACGRVSACSIGLALCMRDEKYLDKAIEIWKKYRIDLLEELYRRREEVKEGKYIRYIVMENAQATGPIATIFSRYLYSDKPFIAINIKNDRAKVSARGNDKIKVDLAEVMRKAAEKVGGRGGGHRVAAGANISPDKVDEFIKEVDRLCSSVG
ncbi:MAG TPA: phosphoesterase, partial [Archaeoglobus profundus]|nr:phosphoesterase [Archaeoglobus profundus]